MSSRLCVCVCFSHSSSFFPLLQDRIRHLWARLRQHVRPGRPHGLFLVHEELRSFFRTETASVVADSYLLVFNYADVQRVETAYWRQQRRAIGLFLTANALFADWSEARVRSMAMLGIMRLYQRGEVVFAQGQSVPGFYLVLQGEARVTRHVDAVAQVTWPVGPAAWESCEYHEGHTVSLATLGRHDCFGEDAAVPARQVRHVDPHPAGRATPVSVTCV